MRECRTLEDWLMHFVAQMGECHQPVADAVPTTQLLQVALVAADRKGMRCAADVAMQAAQRWLGKR